MHKKSKNKSSRQESAANDSVAPDASGTHFRNAGFRRRIIALLVILGVILCLFLSRLAQFQLLDGRKYRTQAEGTISQNTSLLPLSSQAVYRHF